MKHLNFLSNLLSLSLGSQSSDLSLDCRFTVGSPSGRYCSGLMRLVFILAILLTVGVGNVWGADEVYKEVIFHADSVTTGTSNYTSTLVCRNRKHSATWNAVNANNNSNNTAWNYIKMGSKKSKSSDPSKVTTGSIITNEVYADAITKVVVYGSLDRGSVSVKLIYASNSAFSSNVVESSAVTTFTSGKMTFNIVSPTASRYYKVEFTCTNSTTSNGVVSISKVEYYHAAAACEANPSIGAASLNGSISLSSIPLSISSVGGGTDCTLAEYGFVWKAGSSPSASDNKTKIGESSSATSFTGNITGSFSTGVTYYIKGYAINNGPNTTLSSTALPITPRSITFNSNGGSSVSTIYVNSGTAASAPTAPTKTGYNFGGWYTDNGKFASAVNWSSTISENKTYFAKWTAKTYSITLDREGASTGATSVTMTYNSSSFTGWSAPSKTGYTFGGYWTGDNGTGSMVIDASGNLQANVTNYTGAGGIWTKDATTTLYAKWTIKNYTVTWKVNGEDYTTGTPTDNVNHGSHVTTLPTAPSPASYCGDKFMGWTDATDGAYVHGTSNLYTSASQFPAATGNQVFYAVFADYDD